MIMESEGLVHITRAELKRRIGAGRKKQGLFILVDGDGKYYPRVEPFTYRGEPVTVVSLDTDGTVGFYGGTGEKKLARFPGYSNTPCMIDSK